jgi:transposase
MENKEAARVLYFEGWSQVRIAQALGVAEKTVTDWKKKGYWEKKRAENAIAKDTAEELVLELINWNLNVLKKRKDEWEAEGKLDLISKGDIDALSKLFSSIKGKEKTWTNYVTILREFVDFLQTVDLEMSKSLLDPVDEFLNQKRKEM